MDQMIFKCRDRHRFSCLQRWMERSADGRRNQTLMRQFWRWTIRQTKPLTQDWRSPAEPREICFTPRIRRTAKLNMYDANFAFVKSFTDTTLSAGFAPFGIQDINGLLYVTFANVNGGSGGFVDLFKEEDRKSVV